MRPGLGRKVQGTRAYSLDPRQKVVAAVERGDPAAAEVAATLGVGQTFVKKMLRRHREAPATCVPARTAQAITLVTEGDIRGWPGHCGYKVTPVGMPLQLLRVPPRGVIFLRPPPTAPESYPRRA